MDLSSVVKDLMSREDRKDAEFRLALVQSQLGDVAKYITHDPALNPNARPHGTRQDEVLAYGQAIAMLAALAHIRGIDYDKALEAGIENWKVADWRKVASSPCGAVRGVMANPGSVQAAAYVVSASNTLKDLASRDGKVIAVMRHATPDFIIAQKSIAGIVTDYGGKTCHAATIARELGIPCIVGTGNATSAIKHLDVVSIEPYKDGLGVARVLERNLFP